MLVGLIGGGCLARRWLVLVSEGLIGFLWLVLVVDYREVDSLSVVGYRGLAACCVWLVVHGSAWWFSLSCEVLSSVDIHVVTTFTFITFR